MGNPGSMNNPNPAPNGPPPNVQIRATLPAMPKCVAELVEVVRSAYLAKFPELCGTRVEERIDTAIASVRDYYGSRP